MSRLTVYWDDDPNAPELVTGDWALASGLLAQAGVLFERWPAETAVAADADDASLRAAHAGGIERMTRDRGFHATDIVKVTPATPDIAALRAKFRAEHTHAEDEARLFVEGRGCFHLHINDRVFQIICETGDLISIPAGMRHWFDMGAVPLFTAIRFFTRPDGWVGAYTGDDIATRFSVFS